MLGCLWHNLFLKNMFWNNQRHTKQKRPGLNHRFLFKKIAKHLHHQLSLSNVDLCLPSSKLREETWHKHIGIMHVLLIVKRLSSSLVSVDPTQDFIILFSDANPSLVALMINSSRSLHILLWDQVNDVSFPYKWALPLCFTQLPTAS